MPDTVAAGPWVVLVSERLGPISAIERRLETHGATVQSSALWTQEQIAANGRGARIIILGAVEPFDGPAMDALPELLAIVRRGVGYDNVDLDAATRRGIVVANVPDASIEEVSDHALALLLSAERAVPWLDRAVHDLRWQRDSSEIEPVRAASRRFSTLTLGVIGLGRIGRALVNKAQATYGRIVAADPLLTDAPKNLPGIRLVSLEELLATADHISLHAPMLPSTHHLIDAAALALVRPGVVIVNTSRGGVIDESALIAAITSGRVRAAGLDVTEREPLGPGDPLLGTDRVILTAHSASSSTTTRIELVTRSVDAAEALIRGDVPDSVVNSDVLTSSSLRWQRVASGGPS